MMCLNKDEFCNKLIETLKSKTMNNKLKWSYFGEETNTIIDYKNNIFEYDKKDIIEKYENYQINIENSVFCKIKYGEKLDKIIRVAIVVVEKDLNNKVEILICDREKKDNYIEICNSIHYPEICKLYEIVEFKHIKEFNILEKWLFDDSIE